MKNDIRNLFEESREMEDFSLSPNHKQRFLERLEKEMPKKPKNYGFYIGIAASLLLLFSLGFYFFNAPESEINAQNLTVETKIVPEKIDAITLGDLSPDLKKVEQYYLATINFELAKLEVSDENEELVKAYMEQLAVLNKEYQTLSQELNTVGPNDQTIAALIQNLQLRLQLLQKLKEKLNELKQTKNETVISI